MIQFDSCIRIRKKNPGLDPNSYLGRQKGPQKRKKWRKEVTLKFMKIYTFLRNIFSGGPEADAVRIFLPRIGKQGAT